MPRIRTIKPDLPQRADLGACSRDARLLYLLLKTLVDDEGRARGGPRLLASLLYPYDDPAALTDAAWLAELAAAGLVTTYAVAGAEYVQLEAFRADERIDHPTPSKLPPPPAVPEASQTFAKFSEHSENKPLDRIGEDRIGREGKGKEQGREASSREGSGDLPKVSEPLPAPEPAAPAPTPAPKRRAAPRDPEDALAAICEELEADAGPAPARLHLLQHPAVWPAAVEYLRARRRKRAAETPFAWRTLLGLLAEHGGSDPDRWAALLAHNATAGYMSIYPLPGDRARAAQPPKPSRSDRYLDAAQRLTGSA